jgi:hypothetical protein
MPNVSKNQHRWKTWADDRIRAVLEEAAEALDWAWKRDQKDPESYPINTWYRFVQIEEQLEGQSNVGKGIKLPPPSPPPQTFCELVDDEIIGAVYEEQNEGTYKGALKQAAAEHGEGTSAWRKILRAVDGAYAVSYYGLEHAPKPRVHFLHRNLLAIVDSEHLRGLTLDGIVEFFDDVCPCGKKHQPDALRKLRKRKSNANSGHNETA